MTPPPDLVRLLPVEAVELLTANGVQLVQRLGMDVIRSVILDVLVGRNLRTSTEKLTRKRIAALNLSLVEFFLQQETRTPGFVRQLPVLATQILQQPRLSKANRWLSLWILGLTDKAFQNVLKDDVAELTSYRDSYLEVCQSVVESRGEGGRALSGHLRVGNRVSIDVDGLFLTYLLNTIGASTLAIRGSEKSAYGKLFEKLILGSALTILGFKLTTFPPPEHDRVFWFTSAEEKRESDATLLFTAGKGVRFDIGFIGRGNSEISLDKVSRFEREVDFGRKRAHLSTVVIVDRIGSRSRLSELAARINATVIQMTASWWVQQLAQHLKAIHPEYRHPLVKMKATEVHHYLQERIQSIPLEPFLREAKRDESA